MNLKSIEEKIEQLQEKHYAEWRALAKALCAEHVQKFCDDYGFRFLVGNGTWYFPPTETGLDIDSCRYYQALLDESKDSDYNTRVEAVSTLQLIRSERGMNPGQLQRFITRAKALPEVLNVAASYNATLGEFLSGCEPTTKEA